jgi:uncharacterized protein with PIN domain
MADDKDRLREKLQQKEKAEEDRYFQEQDRLALEKLRRQEAKAAAPTLDRCPRCAEPLQATTHHGVAIEECPAGHGLWLNRGELEEIASRERDSWLGRLFHRAKR